MSTVFDAFMQTAAAHPDSAFLCAPPAPGRAYHPDGVELTFAQTCDEVLRLRELYEGKNYNQGR